MGEVNAYVGFYWCSAAVILGLVTFGFFDLLYGVIYVACFFGGSIAILYENCQKEVQKQQSLFRASIVSDSTTVQTGIEKVLQVDYSKRQLKVDRRLTGSTNIDERIHECLDFLMRDYVKYWYNDLSDDQEFLYNFRVSLHDSIRGLSIRFKSIDWQPYITTTLVDHFISHIKLFRRAQDKLHKFHQSESADYKSEQELPANTPQHNKPGISEFSPEGAANILEFYFENEIIVEHICRDLVSCDKKKQMEYLQDICEVLLYILLPKDDFHCRPLKYLLRETMVHGILLPMFKLYTTPDYLNQYVSWLISDNCVSSEWFLVVLRQNAVLEELYAVREKADDEIIRLRAKDSVGDDPAVKQQLSSMKYVMTLCERQIRKLREGKAYAENGDIEMDNSETARNKLYKLPLSMVLRNNIALQIFIEFMQSVNGQAYLFFWLTVDGYRASAEQQLSEVKVQQLKGSVNGSPDMDMLRTIGHNIYEQYLSKHADPRVPLDPLLDKQLKKKLDSGEPSPYVFDDIQQKVFTIMQRDERFFPEFKASPFYLKLLAELDLLREPSLNSGDTNGSIVSGSSLEEASPGESEDSCKLSALITQTGICTEHGKTYALYAITITRHWLSGRQENWCTFRRYREFYDLHSSLKENGSVLGNLRLPGKTFFKDLKEEFLEKRRSELNQYLHTILTVDHPPKSMECLHTFLDAKAYQKNSRSLAKKVDTMMRTSVRNVTNFVAQAPDNFFDGIQKASDRVSDGFQRFSDKLPNTALERKDSSSRYSEQIEYNADNNIPFGILLLLMDEVFDLRQKNKWLRRQMVAAVQQVMRTLFGDRMNRKIIDYVDNAVSAEQVSESITKFRDNFWPSGVLAEETPAREEGAVMRTRVLTKSKIHGVIPDELRPIVGNETSRRGAMRLFELIQHPELNQRFICVLLEGVLNKIFPSNSFLQLFNDFHSSSPKVRAHKREMMSQSADKGKPHQGGSKSSSSRNGPDGGRTSKNSSF